MNFEQDRLINAKQCHQKRKFLREHILSKICLILIGN